MIFSPAVPLEVPLPNPDFKAVAERFFIVIYSFFFIVLVPLVFILED